MTPVSHTRSYGRDRRDRKARPFCQCCNKRTAPMPWKQLSACKCGEDLSGVSEWKWQHPSETGTSWVVVSEDQRQVTFHPSYSSGTAAVRGDTAMKHNYHYYWEVKMLTDTYGTDIMVGIGTDKVNIADSQFKFTSLLGQDSESYGLSYMGAVRHNAIVAHDSPGFCRGAIIGVKVDLWTGTLEFYLNRKSQGISFYNLRRHQTLFPMICSTAAQSSMRLIYAASWKASLLVDAVKVLAASVPRGTMRLPPGLWHRLRSQFWLTLPAQGVFQACIVDEEKNEEELMEADPVAVTNMLSEILPSPYANGFYIDNVERNYRMVLWE